MRYGFIIPDIQGVSATQIVDLAREAESSGWDAIFFWDGDWGFSPWVTLSAMAVQTDHIRIGAILHPLAWRQPWLFARETATLDQLSRGRLVVSIGLGAINEQDTARGRTRFGEPVDRKVRAQLMDEGLEIINGLWSGQPVTFHGEHHHMDEFSMRPIPVQTPRIPIWAVGVWGKRKSMERVLRSDGMLVHEGMSVGELHEIKAFVEERRTLTSPFDLVMEADTRGDTAEQARAKVRGWEDAGVTWWTESMWTPPCTLEEVRTHIRQGPPANP